MKEILPLLLLPAPFGEGKPLAGHILLGKSVFQFARDTLEAVAGPCIALQEGGADAKSQYPCERESAASFSIAVASFGGNAGKVLAVYGDMPCLTPETLQFLLAAVEGDCKASFLQWQGEDLEQEPGLRLGGTAYCFEIEALKQILAGWEKENGQEECTPLDALTALLEQGIRIAPVAADGEELISVKTRLDLANAFACLQEQINLSHMENGVIILAPDKTYIEADVAVGPDTVIYPGCFLQRGTKIGARCTLLPNSRLKGAVLHDQVTVESSVLLDCEVGSGTTVGPFAYLRPDTRIGEKCRIGDFVEIKNSVIGDGTKVSHLTYVGDGDLGENINLGCGVVFTNYDGKKKHRSIVEDDAFIGCNVNLVAPVHVGREAYVAAGSTVTGDVPEGSLYVARSQGVVKEGWVQKRKEAGKL